MFAYIRARFRFALIGGNLKAQSTGSHRGIESGIQIPETWLQALLPPSPRAARALLRARSQAKLSRSFKLYLTGIILQWSLASFRWR